MTHLTQLDDRALSFFYAVYAKENISLQILTSVIWMIILVLMKQPALIVKVTLSVLVLKDIMEMENTIVAVSTQKCYFTNAKIKPQKGSKTMSRN